MLGALIAGCSGGGWLLPALYNRVDNIMAGRFEDYANFDRDQRAWIRQAAREFQDWHRVSELPRYADLMDSIAVRIEQQAPPLQRAEVAMWVASFDARSAASQRCNPLYRAGEFLRDISDRQVEQIDKHMAARYDEFHEEYASQSPAERTKKSTKTGTKWLRRIGLDLNPAQQMVLHDTIAAQAGSRGEFFELWRGWSKELVTLLRQRRQPDAATTINAHLARLESLSERADPERYARNRAHWIDYFTALGNSLSAGQRDEFVLWLRDTADTLRKLATEHDGLLPPDIVPGDTCPRQLPGGMQQG